MASDWLQEFESRLESIERAAAEHVPLGQLLQDCHRALLVITEIRCVGVYLDSNSTIDRIVHTTEFQREITASEISSVNREPLVIESSGPDIDSKPTVMTVLVARWLGANQKCVLQIDSLATGAARDYLCEAASALVPLMAELLSHQIVTSYESRLDRQRGLTELAASAYDTDDQSTMLQALVDDGALLFEHTNLVLIQTQMQTSRVVAATGGSDLRPESQTVRAIEAATSSENQLLFQKQWFAPSDDLVRESLARFAGELTALKVEQFRYEPLTDHTPANNDSSWSLLLLCFSEGAIPDNDGVDELASVFRRILSRPVRTRSGLLTSKRAFTVLLGIVACLVLILVPADFEIEATGQILPEQRQRVFAPEDGVIQSVDFENEQVIEKDKLLFTMSNPDLDLEYERIRGELIASEARLESISLFHLNTGATTEENSDSQFSTEELLLEKKIESLNIQLGLVEQQLAALVVNAPISGTVFQSDSTSDLLARPVRRGQLLCEILSNTGRWQLELQIPDDQIGYVNKYRADVKEDLALRYTLNSSPEHEWDAEMDRVDRTIQIVDGRLVCLAHCSLAEAPELEFQPGASIRARIYCGRRSLGFVIFRELIEFGNRVRFAWF